jgi:hypothetical protein
VAHAVEGLLRKHEVLSSVPSTEQRSVRYHTSHVMGELSGTLVRGAWRPLLSQHTLVHLVLPCVCQNRRRMEGDDCTTQRLWSSALFCREAPEATALYSLQRLQASGPAVPCGLEAA